MSTIKFGGLAATAIQLAQFRTELAILTEEQIAAFNLGNILALDGSVSALSEITPEVLANPSATTTVRSGPGLYYHYRCTGLGGTITVYDSLTASGKLLVPTTALALGAFPIFGAGTSRVLTVTLGVTVVLSGAGVVYVGVEAG